LASLSARSLNSLPEIRQGDDLAWLIVDTMESVLSSTAPRDDQIVVISHKVVSKAEGAVVRLCEIDPTPWAVELAEEHEKDPRAIQVVLDQSAEIIRSERGVIISRTHHGFVCANAGVDASNSASSELLVLLPHDPDSSARAIRARLGELTGSRPAIAIADSFGRAWRHGQCDVMIGCAGMVPLDDWRGRADSMGMQLNATWLAVGDAVCAMADLARAKDSREPVVVIDGLEHLITSEDGPGASALLRPLAEDMFR